MRTLDKSMLVICFIGAAISFLSSNYPSGFYALACAMAYVRILWPNK